MTDGTGIGGTKPSFNPPNPRGNATGLNYGRGMGSFSRLPDTQPIRSSYGLATDPFTDGTDIPQKARLYSESVGFPNLANREFVQQQAKMAVLAGLNDVFNVMEFLRNKWLVLYRLWRGDTLDTYSYGRLRLHSPEPFKIVESLLPKILRVLFGSERWFKFYGEQQEQDDNARLQEALCRQQLRETDYVAKASRFIRDGLIFGTSVQKSYWNQETDEVSYRTGKRIPDPRFPGASKIELEDIQQQELVFDGNEVKQVEIFDFLAPPSASSLNEAQWCADRSSWPDYRVKQMAELGHWINVEALKSFPGTNDTSFGDEFKERKAYAYGVFDPRQATQAPTTPHYEVIDWWGPLVIEDNNGNLKTRMCNVVMIEPKSLQIVARVTQNPFWHRKKPYQCWRPISATGELFGVGAIEMIARLSMEKDMKRQLLMASSQLEGNPMFVVSDEANIPNGQFVAQPGGVIRVPGDPTKAIVPLHVPQVSDAALKAENILTVDIRETAGATSPSMGARDPFGDAKTATQHMAEVDEGNLRLVPMVEAFESEVIVPMLDQFAWNNQQFQSYDRVVREVGALGMRFHDRYTIRPQDLIGRFIVQPLASHRLTTRQTQVQQLVNVLDRAPVINQMYGPDTVNMPSLLAMILEYGFDIRNVDEFIRSTTTNQLLTPTREHALWYHGNVPPRRQDDNDMRHYTAHVEEFSTPQFAELEKRSPGTAARARAHAAIHLEEVERLFLEQESRMMKFAQMGGQQQAMGGGGGGGGGSPVAGAAGPGQQPGSPKVRRNENGRGENGPQGEAMRRAPNPGAQ